MEKIVLKYIEGVDENQSFYNQTIKVLMISSFLTNKKQKTLKNLNQTISINISTLNESIYIALRSIGFDAKKEDSKRDFANYFSNIISSNNKEKEKNLWLFSRICYALFEHEDFDNNLLKLRIEILNSLIFELKKQNPIVVSNFPMICWALAYTLIAMKQSNLFELSKILELRTILKAYYVHVCGKTVGDSDWNSDQAWSFVMTFYAMTNLSNKESFIFLAPSLNTTSKLKEMLVNSIPQSDFRCWAISLTRKAIEIIGNNDEDDQIQREMSEFQKENENQTTFENDKILSQLC